MGDRRYTFISFLGAGRYEECRYRFSSGETSGPVVYVQEALVRSLCQGYGEDDVVRVFVTPKARQAHWEALRSRLAGCGLRCRVEAIDIEEGRTEADIWKLFQTMYSAIGERDSITFDLTHGFRYLPMLFFSILNYAQYLKHISVEGIYYGAYEAKDADNVAPIFNLQDAYRLLQWASAADSFINYGMAEKLAHLAQGLGNNEAAALAANVSDIADVFHCTRGYEIMNGKLFSDTISQIRSLEDTGELSPVFTPILTKLSEHLGNFRRKSSLNFIPAVQWYIDHNMTAQGYTMLREGIVSYLMEAAGLSLNEKYLRNSISAGLNGNDDYKSNPLVRAADWPKLEKVMGLSVFGSLKAVFKGICRLRNDIDHGGMQQGSHSALGLRNELLRYFRLVKDMVEAEEAGLAVASAGPDRFAPSRPGPFPFLGESVGPKKNLRGTLEDGRRGSVAGKYFREISASAEMYVGKKILVTVIGENPQRTGVLLEPVDLSLPSGGGEGQGPAYQETPFHGATRP